MNPSEIRILFEYNYRTHRRIWDCIMQLTEEQFVQPIPYSRGSLRDHCLHLIGGDRRWLARLKGASVPDYPTPEEAPDRATVRAMWDVNEVLMMGYIGTLSDKDLRRILLYDMPKRGGMKATPVWQILVQMVNHGTDHRAQMLRILYELGGPTIEQDFIVYLWNHD